MAEHKSQSSFPYIAIVALVAVVAVVVLVLNYNSSDSSLVVDEEGNVVGEASRWRTSITSTESRQAQLQAREDQRRAQERKENYCFIRAARDPSYDQCIAGISRVCAANDDDCRSSEGIKCAEKGAEKAGCCADSTTQQQQELCFK